MTTDQRIEKMLNCQKGIRGAMKKINNN